MTAKPPSGHFRLLYFASAASFTGKSVDDFSAPLPITELFGALEERYPGISHAVLSSAAVTVNLDYVDVEELHQSNSKIGESKGLIINESDEVAIIPPVSSG